MQQLNLFDVPVEQKQGTIQVHDKVKFLLLDESVDSEVHYYRKYYFGHVIGKVGTVLEVESSTVLVKIADEEILFEIRELEWIA